MGISSEPFKCDEEDCDKAFASAASLAVHKVNRSKYRANEAFFKGLYL
jgi:hypothetical protein